MDYFLQPMDRKPLVCTRRWNIGHDTLERGEGRWWRCGWRSALLSPLLVARLGHQPLLQGSGTASIGSHPPHYAMA